MQSLLVSTIALVAPAMRPIATAPASMRSASPTMQILDTVDYYGGYSTDPYGTHGYRGIVSRTGMGPYLGIADPSLYRDFYNRGYGYGGDYSLEGVYSNYDRSGYGRYGRRYGREPYYHGPFYGYGRLQGIPSGGYGYRRGSIGGGEHRLGTVSRETTMDRDYQRDRGMYGGYVYNRNYGRYGDYSLEGRW